MSVKPGDYVLLRCYDLFCKADILLCFVMFLLDVLCFVILCYMLCYVTLCFVVSSFCYIAVCSVKLMFCSVFFF